MKYIKRNTSCSSSWVQGLESQKLSFLTNIQTTPIMRITEVVLSYKYSDNSHVYISQLRDASSGEIQPQSC